MNNDLSDHVCRIPYVQHIKLFFYDVCINSFDRVCLVSLHFRNVEIKQVEKLIFADLVFFQKMILIFLKKKTPSTIGILKWH